MEDLPAGEAYLITDVKKSQATFDAMIARYGTLRVKAPRLLHIRTDKPAARPESP